MVLKTRNGLYPVPDSILRLARAIARAEGFYVAGSLPQRMNNPGSITDPATGKLRQYPSVEAGWNALYRQIEAMASGRSAYYSPDMTLREIALVYTGNDKPDAWARIVAESLGVSPDVRFGDLVGA